MAEADESAAEFEFDPDQLTELGDLAEAFIHEEVDTALFDDLNREYLLRLVDNAETEPPSGVNPDEYQAAIEVAELILDRMDAAGQ
jgi:hypothetical protein